MSVRCVLSKFIFKRAKSFPNFNQIALNRRNLLTRIKIFVLNPPRDLLYEKINRRTEIHFENGLIEEVKNLRQKGLRDDTNALGAHGYRRVCEYLRGERTLESAIEKTKQDIRNYAKRQMTWFRREEDVIWLEGFGNEVRDTRKAILEMILRS